MPDAERVAARARGGCRSRSSLFEVVLRRDAMTVLLGAAGE